MSDYLGMRNIIFLQKNCIILGNYISMGSYHKHLNKNKIQYQAASSKMALDELEDLTKLETSLNFRSNFV